MAEEEYSGGAESSLVGFFYTFEKSLKKMDDDELFAELVKKHENLEKVEDDALLRKEILDILENEEYVNSLLEKFSMTILDFISALYRKLGTVFANASFIRKLKVTMVGKSYAKQYFD
jgi:hypothetical protein